MTRCHRPGWRSFRGAGRRLVADHSQHLPDRTAWPERWRGGQLPPAPRRAECCERC